MFETNIFIKMLEFGYEWIYENMITYGGYDIYKKLQCLNKQWYQMLDQPWFRTEDSVQSRVKLFRNGLRLITKGNSKCFYNGFIQHGPEYCYYDDGKLLYKCININGFNEGQAQTYWNNGNVGSIIYFKRGKLNGLCRKFHINGVLSSECVYVDGNMEGQYKRYDDKGLIFESSTYSKDKLNGTLITYYSNGVVEIYAEYKDDKRHGKYRKYDTNGKLLKSETYKNGIKV